MPLILGAQSAVDTGFTVDNSCRFDAATGAWMYRAQETPTGTGTKASFSCWVKQGKYMATGGYLQIQDFAATSSFSIYENAGDIGFNALNDSGYVARRYTDAKLRDPGAWTHIFALWNTTDAVAADRMQLWVNGVRITSFSLDTDPVQDSTLDCLDNSVVTRQIVASYSYGGGSYFDGYMSQVAFCDGQALAATDFGEFDEDSPTIWKPKKISTLTFGDAGWYLDFGDSASMGADVSGNGNDMTTVTNIDATDQATDSPTNNFAVFNPLNYPSTGAAITFSEGNCKVVSQSASANYFGATSTLGMSAGKWYCEFNFSSVAGDSMVGIIGTPAEQARNNQQTGYTTSGFAYMNDGQKKTDLTASAYDTSYTNGDVLGCAIDITNLKVYFAKDNVWQDSGDPTSGASGTGAAFTILAPSLTPEGFYAFSWSDNSSSASTVQVNFGGCAGWTLTSAENDENGYGNFEYAPPSGYLALCTKNLGSDGG